MSKMKLGNLTSTILILVSYFCVQSAPAKPLNERSTELTWQAWLLVDEQNQNKQYDAEGLLRRRITPKSVFIAPTFSPESLPACADGYTSDPMGRCIKIIQLDADAHLNFILDRLKQQFGNFDEYEDEEEVDENLPTPGPFQFNIPLGEVPQAQPPQEDTNVAIVVAPTNGNFNFSKNDSFTFTVKRDPNNTSQVDAPVIVTKINVEDEISENPTSEAPPTTTETTTTETESTITTDEITTVESTSLIETTTFINDEQEEEQAIFFKLPELNKPFETKANETRIIQPPENSNIQLPPKVDVLTKFREETAEIASQLLPHAKVKTKFDGLFDDLIKDVEHPDRIFTNRDTVKQKTTEPPQVDSQVYNHRNRDKWFFPSSNWRETPPQKPLVLRFNNLPSGKQASHFYHHPRQGGMYREVPPEDLSYIFGFKKGTHR